MAAAIQQIDGDSCVTAPPDAPAPVTDEAARSQLEGGGRPQKRVFSSVARRTLSQSAAVSAWLNESRVRLAFLIGFLVLLNVSAVSYVNTIRLVQQQRRLSREYQMCEHLSTLLTGVSDAEAAQVAYVATGRPAYLERFRTDADQVRNSLTTLRGLTVSEPRQRQRLSQIAPVVSRYLNLLHHAVDLRSAGRTETALAASLRIDRDAKTAGEIHRLGRTMRKDALRLLAQQERMAELTATQTQSFILLKTVGATALLGIAFLVLGVDMRERRRQEDKLREVNEQLAALAAEDALTSLKNRRAFEEHLRMEWSRASRYNQPLSLLMIDVDRFKQYNDNFGHPAGDVALRQFAKVLKHSARESDFVARYGGEEFTVLLPHTNSEAAVRTGERLLALLTQCEWPGRPVTASVGVATMTPAMGGPMNLVYEADLALYFAKRNGRNQVAHLQGAGDRLQGTASGG